MNNIGIGVFLMTSGQARTVTYSPSHGDYFGLPLHGVHAKLGLISVNKFKYDLQRGVKRLPDYAFSSAGGASLTSLQFLMVCYNHLELKGVSAKMSYKNNKYLLEVNLLSGHLLVFTGVGSGYVGEGSRTAYDILKACGFSESQLNNIWNRENFRIFRRNVQ